MVQVKKCKRRPQIPKSEYPNRVSMIKEIPERHFSSGFYDRKTLKRVLSDLSKLREERKEPPAKAYCQLDSLNKKNALDQQIKLRCRQLPSVVQQLRKAIMRQNWDDVTTLLIILCHPGLTHYCSIIMRVCFILLFNHPESDITLVQNFIRHSTEYILDEDINKFIRILFALRSSALIPLKCGKYIRRTGGYKITWDPEFKNL